MKLSDGLSVAELAKFMQFVGCGIRKIDDPSSYKQILPEVIFIKAIEVFRSLKPDHKNAFLALLHGRSGNDETKALAISTLFAVLAYGKDFVENFIKAASTDDNRLKVSFTRSQEYFGVQPNFTQNYLNTCVAVSAFAALSNAFCGNVEVLSFAVEYEVRKVNELPRRISDDSHPAYESHSWRKAPTVNEERSRLIDLCETKLRTLEEARQGILLSPEAIKWQQEQLLHVMETVSALQSAVPTLLSTRVLKTVCSPIFDHVCGKCEFISSCVLNVAGSLLAKVALLGAYVSSLSLEERLMGVKFLTIGFIDSAESEVDFETRNLAEVWAEIFRREMTLESRSDGGHCVAVKAAQDEHGEKYLVVYDPIQGAGEIIQVPEHA
jgi:hypothetical protein